jgi:predicted PurR-regulated permease PerM
MAISATVVAALFAPWVVRLTQRGRSRVAAAALVWCAALATAVGVLVLLAVALVSYAGDIVARLDAAQSSLDARLASLGVPPEVAHAATTLIAALRGVGGHRGVGDGGHWGATHGDRRSWRWGAR